MKRQVAYAVSEDVILQDGFNGFIYEPKGTIKGLVLFYHGWGSSAERQRFRCRIIASAGYTTLVVNAAHHDPENPLDYMDPWIVGRYFWATIASNIKSFPQLLAMAKQYASRSDIPVWVMGHSMGAYTGLGLMASYPLIDGLVAYNGASDWHWANSYFLSLDKEVDLPQRYWQTFSELIDPWSARQQLLNRFIFLTNGEQDTVVPKEGNARLSAYLSEENPQMFASTIYPEQGHFVTDGMLNDGLDFMQTAVDKHHHI